MANIIDALLITLGLDAKGVKTGTEDVKKSLKGTEDSTKRTANEMEAASKKMTEAYRKVRNEILGLFALVSAGRGMKQMVGDITGSDAALGRFSKRINISTEELSAWQQAVIRVGGSADGFAGSAQSLTDAFEQQQLHGINPLIAHYRALGVSMNGVDGKMKPVTQQLREFAQVVADKKISGPQAAVNFREMGLDQGTINLLMEGPKAIDALVDRMTKLGVVHEKDAKNAQALKANLDDLKQGFESLVRTVINDLSPMVIDIMKKMSDWLTVNREWLALKIDEYLKSFIDIVKEAPAQIKAFKDSIDPVVEALGGWVRTTEILFGLWAISRVAGVISAITGIGSAIFGVAGKSGLGRTIVGGVGGLAVGGWAYDKIQEQHVAAGGKPQTVQEGGIVKWIADIMSGKGDNGFGRGPASSATRGFNETEKDDLYRRFLQFQESFEKAIEDAKKMTANDLVTANNALGGQGYTGGLGNERHPGTGAKINTGQGARDAYQFWIGKGFTPQGAAAMVAGENTESGFNPAARGDYVNGAPTAFGLYQWHGDRAQRILNRTGIDVRTASAAQQREAHYQEMKLGLDPQSGAAFPYIRDAKDARTAGAIHSSQVERPADRQGNMIKRGNDAQAYLNALNSPGAYSGIGPIPMSASRPLTAGPRVGNDNGGSPVTVGDVHIHTAATDADGIAADANRALQRRITPIQANTGLR